MLNVVIRVCTMSSMKRVRENNLLQLQM
jgi:hypothetical protein